MSYITLDGDLSEMRRLEALIKQKRNEIKPITERLNIVKERFYNNMKRYGKTEYGGVKLPKPKAPRKKKADKEKDAINFLAKKGYPDPQGLYKDMLKAQNKIKN